MTSGYVDLRSDTLTKPTPEMRKAMADAEVGDDVYGEDPTVNRLEELYAERVGMEAALYCPSGVMCNQIAIRVHTAGRAGVVVAGARQHVVIYENGAAGRNAGVQFHTIDDGDGLLSPTDLAWAFEAPQHHYPSALLVCVENTHMPADGRPWPIDAMRTVGEMCAAVGVPIHMDGARLFNAEVASGVSATDYCAPVTTVMSCLSKALCAPIGSVLAGPQDFVNAARGERARMGGGMRQAGVIAAAGIVALTTMVERLAEDHRRARQLADAVAERWPDGGCDPSRIQTNVVTWRHPEPLAVIHRLRSEGVLAGTIAPGVLRLVTHNDVDDDGIERARKALSVAP